ncbi:ABC transporter ATP-binding protein [Thiohalomonas denitrificans]|uniref:Iron complex transport system ATP-binding protein n=1 Tax=Thiohalomonas denitrificans TaxID=415747 RepID=A0A1G5PME8_9GAMM|nr:ABC transporter ATP-binding protein [Thiohalomonas denitrificans]SCZ50724.1 iron complex transport system ATP-binding protein [Thiohalomonas denitrificans]
MSPAPLLTAEELTLSVPGKTLCRDLDMEVAPGERWTILGPNGAGKTTLLLTLAGLHPPDTGRVYLDGQLLSDLPRRKVAKRLGILPQESRDPFPATVLETALLGRHPHLSPWRGEGPQDRSRAIEALHSVDLDGFLERDAASLSGGERRRLAVATLLTQDPQLLLLDEPTNHLDLRHQIAILDQQRRLSENGRGIVMVLHDPNLAARYATHALLLFGDGHWEAGSAEELLEEQRLSTLYGYPVAAVEGPAGRAFLPR